MATVTMEESEYLALKSAVVAADERTAAVKAELETERARSFDERLDQLSKAFSASKEIVDYAVGNLDPEFSRGWPHEAVATLAECVSTLPSATTRDAERALIWKAFHARIIDFDMRWKRGETGGTVSYGTIGEIAKLSEQPRPSTRVGEADRSIVYLALSILIGILLCGGAVLFYWIAS